MGDDMAADPRQRFASEADALSVAALAAVPAGTPAWDAALAAVGVRPPTAEARREILAVGIPQLRGALPTELRQALEAVRRRIRRESGPWDAAAIDEALDASIAERISAYLRLCRPPVGLGAIFANAQLTTRRSEDPGGRMQALKCPCCGAARPSDAGLRTCAYCGHDLFPGKPS